MSLVVSIWNKRKIIKHVMVAGQNKNDLRLYLSGKAFWIEQDLTLYFELSADGWIIRPDESCSINLRDKAGRHMSVTVPFFLADGMLFDIITRENETLHMYIYIKEKLLVPNDRYLIDSDCDITIGSDGSNIISHSFKILDELIREKHGVIAVRSEGAYLYPYVQDGFYINGAPVKQGTALSFGDVIDLYDLRLVWLGNGKENVIAFNKELGDVSVNESVLSEFESDENPLDDIILQNNTPKELFHRGRRNVRSLESETIVIEEPPEKESGGGPGLLETIGHSFLMVIPMLAGCLLMIIASRRAGGGTSLFMYSGLVMAVSSAIVGVIWGIISIRTQRKKRKERDNHRFEAYSNYLIRKKEQISAIYANNTKILYEMYPDAAACTDYNRLSTALWDRNTSHEDFLRVRIGIGDIPFQVKIEIPPEKFHLNEDGLREKPEYIKKNYETLYNVPITVDLKKEHLIGIVGGEERYGAFEIARSMIVNLAATHCYTDVKMVFIYNEESMTDVKEWDFVRWLPHTWSEDRKLRYVAGNMSEIADVSYALSNIFHNRLEENRNSSLKTEHSPYFILFLSDPSLIEGELISGYVYQNSEKVGLTTLILSELYEDLPNECGSFFQNDGAFSGFRDFGGKYESNAVKFDTVDLPSVDRFARNITDIRVKENGVVGELPDSITFLRMYGADTLDDLDVLERWGKNRIYENIRGYLGFMGADEPCILDLHEKYHGPHGLVAGTTGSGKSETLQSYLLSLAVNYGPDDISFFIIDYKGGGMANLFNGLPHMSGSISNLSGTQIKRAMVSIKAENRRRQLLFNAAGVNNINRYTRLYKNGDIKEPIPHLLIVIDEFAELKREEPDFMRELISVAQVGRSLGVHLILSTQKPSGTVDDNIWSNSRFRICLRVQTKEDSAEMLGHPDAAYITQAGRGYLQVGSDEVYELFQSGYSGAVYDPMGDVMGAGIEIINRTGQTEYRNSNKKKSDAPEISQFDAVINYLKKIAEENGYANAHRLWMPLLSNPVYLDSFSEYTDRCFDEQTGSYRTDNLTKGSEWDLSALIGQTDDPRNQMQSPYKISLSQSGHIAVIGSAVSGKSTLLSTIIYSFATLYSPEYINFYAIDHSGRMLSSFEELPHMGGIVYDDDDEKRERLFNLLSEMLTERQKVFRGGNFSQYFRANGAKYPAVMIVIDNFADFNEKTDGKYLPFIIRLSKEGSSNGMFLVLSAAAYNSNEIPSRVSSNIGTGICLALADKFAYGDILHTIRIDVMPEAGMKGRGLAYVGERILELQTALPLEAEDDYHRLEAVRAKVRNIKESWQGNTALRIPEIPEHPTWEIFADNDIVKEHAMDDRFLPFGYRSDNAKICDIDLYKTYCYLVCGAESTGKTSLLRLMANSALMKKNASLVIIDEPVKLRDFDEDDRVKVIRTAGDLYNWCLNDLTPLFRGRNERKRKLVDDGYEGEEYYDELCDFNSVIIIVTSIPMFIKSIYTDEHGMKGFMETIMKKGSGHKITFIGAMDPSERSSVGGYEAFNIFTSYKTGVHLGGNSALDPYLSFRYMSTSEQVKILPPGLGQLSDKSGGSKSYHVVIPHAVRRRKERVKES